MNKLVLYVLLAIGLSEFSSAQSIELTLKKAGFQYFNNKLHAFGLIQNDSKAKLMVYELNSKLSKTDSLQFDISKGKIDDYLDLSSDTLHDQLNIYLQHKENKSVQILKISKKSKTTGLSEAVDVARVNSLAIFQNDIYYFMNDVYTLKSIQDTSGRQFYLNKHSLKTEKAGFEYEQKWQFPFERKNIRSARIIYADRKIVLVFVHVGEGDKKGQWVLKVSAMNGNLRKGTRIGEKGDPNCYFFNQIKVDTSTGTIHLAGQRFSEKDLNFEEKKFNLSTKTALSIYMTSIDSGGLILNNSEFKIPILEQKGYVNKTAVSYLVRMNSFEKDQEGAYKIGTEIYKANTGSLCYKYCNSTNIKIKEQDGQFNIEKNTIGTHPMIEKHYQTVDLLDMNGKLCVDSLLEFDRIYTKNINFKAVVAFKLDETGNPVWLLKKTETKKGTENYSVLGPVKKIYQLSSIIAANKNELPGLQVVSPTNFLISRQVADKFLLQIYYW